jgi:predicted nucleic acid-binding protein
VAVKAILPNPLQNHCLALVQTFIEVQPAAPALWAYETTSTIAKSVHFGAITETEAQQALEELDALGVRLFVAEPNHNLAAFNWTLRLKRASAYDSYYLVLAQTLECSFWTADKRLFNALQEDSLGWVHWIEEMTP